MYVKIRIKLGTMCSKIDKCFSWVRNVLKMSHSHSRDRLQSKSMSSSSRSTWMSSSSSGWLEQVVRRQRSEHLKPFRMQSHESSLQACLYIHDISSISLLVPGVHSSNLSPISLELRHLQETNHDQLEMEHRCSVENFSISLLDSWLAGNAYTSCLGMEAADGIPLHLNEYMNIYHRYGAGKHFFLSLNFILCHCGLIS